MDKVMEKFRADLFGLPFEPEPSGRFRINQIWMLEAYEAYNAALQEFMARVVQAHGRTTFFLEENHEILTRDIVWEPAKKDGE